MSTEYAWVIEGGEACAPIYWAPRQDASWSRDSLAALRFARREDAEHMRDWLCDVVKEPDAVDFAANNALRVAEHGWG